MHRPLQRQPTRWIGATPTTHLTRSAQIPIAPAARPYVPLTAVSSLGGFRTPAGECAALSIMRPASETLHKSCPKPLRRLTSARSPRGGQFSAAYEPPERPKAEINGTNGLTRRAICRHQNGERCRDAFRNRYPGSLLDRRSLLQFHRASLHASLPRVTERRIACSENSCSWMSCAAISTDSTCAQQA